ncbi:hypothetical protein [Streptomyces sp. ME02-8801-2C]|uniref:hypothetical protein n=1 Tax=Streptomyces sp. ME02-8801-2C TaxID=3028680 RepID=UPI0039F666DC
MPNRTFPPTRHPAPQLNHDRPEFTRVGALPETRPLVMGPIDGRLDSGRVRGLPGAEPRTGDGKPGPTTPGGFPGEHGEIGPNLAPVQSLLGGSPVRPEGSLLPLGGHRIGIAVPPGLNGGGNKEVRIPTLHPADARRIDLSTGRSPTGTEQRPIDPRRSNLGTGQHLTGTGQHGSDTERSNLSARRINLLTRRSNLSARQHLTGTGQHGSDTERSNLSARRINLLTRRNNLSARRSPTSTEQRPIDPRRSNLGTGQHLTGTGQHGSDAERSNLSARRNNLSAGRNPIGNGQRASGVRRSGLLARWDGLEVGRWCLAVGRWCLEVGRWCLAVGRWCLAVGSWPFRWGGWLLGLGACPRVGRRARFFGAVRHPARGSRGSGGGAPRGWDG